MRPFVCLIASLCSTAALAHDGPFFSIEHIDAVIFLACFGVVAILGCASRFARVGQPVVRERISGR